MTRAEIIAANPIADFLRNRGHELRPAGENFVTSGCPVTQHKKFHRPRPAKAKLSRARACNWLKLLTPW
jgi:hypothetical protein